MSRWLFLKKGFKFRTQHPGLPADGPLTPALQMMTSHDHTNSPISPVGYDLVNLLFFRKFRVGFMHTGGSGIAPWKGWIILDADLFGTGQTSSARVLGQIAHELTHLLQRQLKPSSYWPSGYFRPSFSHRWIGDSTNFMEVLAYIIGWSVEYDFTRAQLNQKAAESSINLSTLSHRLATLTDPDIRKAIQLILDMYPDNLIYRQNYLTEKKVPGGRIPPGTWSTWLCEIGFSLATVSHIQQIVL